MDRLVQAYATLVVLRSQARHRTQKVSRRELIPLTVPEVRTLLAALILTRPMVPAQTWAFSRRRRRHQFIARRWHYKARGSPPLEVEM